MAQMVVGMLDIPGYLGAALYKASKDIISHAVSVWKTTENF